MLIVSSATQAQLLLDSVDDAIIVVGPDLDVAYANARARTLSGASDGPIESTRLVHPDDLDAAVAALQRVRRDGRLMVRLRLVLPDGEMPVEVTLTDHVATPGIHGVVACFRDLTREDELAHILDDERELARRVQLALTDPLTTMPGRRLVHQRLQQALELAAERRETVAVFFIDLDGFRHINHALGHAAGDAMIRSTAATLMRIHTDVHHWGRIGGDEFLLFVPGIDWDEANWLGRRLAEAGRRTVALTGGTFVSTMSIGVTIASPTDGTRADEVVREADIAMHAGKRTGGQVVCFDPAMQHLVARAAEIEGQLRAGLRTSPPGFALQPIMNVATASTYAVEALVRFRSPSLGLVRADELVDIAERAGLIHELDRQVLSEACRMVGPLVDPVDGMPLSLSVNTTSTTMPGGERLVDRVVDVLESTGFEPHRLILEITESSAIEADAALVADLAMLRRLGVRIAIDDFGTGHSSLGQLERLEVDIVKIDRSFIRDIVHSPRRRRYLQSIIQLVDALDVEIVLEGIETAAEYGLVVPERARLLQGFLFSAPVPPRDLIVGLRAASGLVQRLNRGAGRPYQQAFDWTVAAGADPVPPL